MLSSTPDTAASREELGSRESKSRSREEDVWAGKKVTGESKDNTRRQVTRQTRGQNHRKENGPMQMSGRQKKCGRETQGAGTQADKRADRQSDKPREGQKHGQQCTDTWQAGQTDNTHGREKCQWAEDKENQGEW